MRDAATDWSAEWTSAWSACALTPPSPDTMRALLARYEEAHRHYHTRRHLAECLVRLAGVRPHARQPGEVALALWYHDAVYDPHRSDNEAVSAGLAAAALEQARGPKPIIDRIVALILATKHDAAPAPGDAALLVDIDLGILAAPADRFDEYEVQVRAEYAWVPGFLFRRKRREILEGFLDRERVFVSGHFDADEGPARANLTRSIAKL